MNQPESNKKLPTQNKNNDSLGGKEENKRGTQTQSSQAVSLNQKVDRLGNFSLNMLRSVALWRLSGYALLLLFLMDLAEIFIPPRFLNAQWEFEVFGQIVERVPIPLLSFILIFYGGKYLRKSWEYIFLTIASWLTVLIGVIFILAVPLGIINTIRIDTQTSDAINRQANGRLEVLQQVENRLGDVENAQQMQVLIAQLNRGNTPRIQNDQQLEQAKTSLRNLIEQNRTQINTNSKATIKQARRGLLKRSVKWNAGALVSGVLFISIWQMTKWARTTESLTEV